MGVAWAGGPLYADAFGAKRGPTPYQLIEAYKQIIFACTEFNSLGVSCLDLHLMSTSGKGMEKPRARSEPMSVKRSEIKRIVKLPYFRKSFNTRDVENVHEITQSKFLDAVDKPAVDPKTEMSYFDRQTFVATAVRYLDIVGLAYWKPETPEGVGLQQLVASQVPPPLLWPLQSQYVWPIRETNSALISQFRYFTDYYDPSDLCFIRLRPSLRDPYGSGYAAAQAAWQYSGLEDKGISMWDQLLGTGARPNLVISPKDANMPFGDDERKRYEAELNTYHSKGRAGRSLVTDRALDFNIVEYQGFDTGEMEVNMYNLERIYNCFGCPVAYASRESNLANLQAADKFHAKYGINPRAWTIASALTELVRKYDPRLFWVFDSPIAEDELQEATIVDMKIKAGIMTANQANEDEPWPPRDDGDDPFIPGTLMTPAMILEAHEAGLKAQEEATKQGGEKVKNDAKAKQQKSEKRAVMRANRLLAKLEAMTTDG